MATGSSSGKAMRGTNVSVSSQTQCCDNIIVRSKQLPCTYVLGSRRLCPPGKVWLQAPTSFPASSQPKGQIFEWHQTKCTEDWQFLRGPSVWDPDYGYSVITETFSLVYTAVSNGVYCQHDISRALRQNINYIILATSTRSNCEALFTFFFAAMVAVAQLQPMLLNASNHDHFLCFRGFLHGALWHASCADSHSVM